MKDAANQLPKKGYAIFTPPEEHLWDLRQAAKQALLEGCAAQSFIVTHEEMYYPNMLDRLLAHESEMEEVLLTFKADASGELDESLRCIMLWEPSKEGMLLHLKDKQLLCAYVPLVTELSACKEHQLSLQLTALAEQAQNVPIVLTCSFPQGKHQLSDILHLLSE